MLGLLDVAALPQKVLETQQETMRDNLWETGKQKEEQDKRYTGHSSQEVRMGDTLAFYSPLTTSSSH